MHRFSVRTNRAHEIRWREWGPEVFREAEEQDKLVMLDLTAFWCGFCQRMDETTFSTDDVIALLNGYFIPIRVEDAQRPDIDIRYNQDGWPTIAFLTPQGDHLVSVNYTAPEPFADLLVRLHTLYTKQKAELLAAAAQTREEAARRPSDGGTPRPLGPAIVAEVAGLIEGHADGVHGGYGDSPKMLHPEANEFFLYLFEATGNRAYLDHAVLTLSKMRQSRTYDEVDGGFFRYSTRADWREPHPEKLLADQATLLGNYLHAYLLTDEAQLRETAEALVDYLDSTLSDGVTGAFYGCQDYVRPEGPGPGGPVAGPPRLLSVVDRYVYTDANAQAISAYLEASWVLGKPECKDRALRALEFLWERCRAPEGGMYHCFDGETSRTSGILMDAITMGNALVDAYCLSGEADYLSRAKLLADEVVRDYTNPAGGFFDIRATGPARLEHRLTVLSQNAAAAAFFARMAGVTGDEDYRRHARWALGGYTDAYGGYGAFAAGYGHAMARTLARPLIMTLAGTPGSPHTQALARAAATQLTHPGLIVRWGEQTGEPRAYFTVDGGRTTEPIGKPEEITPERILAPQSS